MPWAETEPMKERMRFVTDWERGHYTVSELCVRYGISRKTGYKWLDRYEAEGVAGLGERSRAPRHCPHRIEPRVARALVEARRQHPSWGPRKLLAWLVQRHPGLELPAASTAGDLLKRRGLIKRRRRRHPWKHPGAPGLVTEQANDVWTADFKGQFRTGDGEYCYPLTIADQHSRYLLACEALDSIKGRGVRPVFRLGIQHQRIEPSHPEQNGAHERMHRTLKAETARPPAQTHRGQQRRFNQWRREYNHERPHESLADKPPATVWRPSPREYPSTIPKPEYPGHHLVRLVSNSGCFRWHARQIFLSQALEQQHIGLEETDDGIWSIYFYSVALGKLDERDFRIHA
jgi:putative transposase